MVTTKPAPPIDAPPEVLQPDLDADPLLRGAELPMFLATRRSFDVRHVSPARNDSPQNQAVLTALARARRVIKLESPNLNDPAVKQALLDAAERGVTVQVVLSLGFNSFAERATVLDQLGARGAQLPGPVKALLDGISAGGSNEDTLQDLYARLSPGARERLQIRWNSPDGKRPSWVQEPGASHTKYLTVDGQLALVGSANMDVISLRVAKEVNVVVDSAATTAALDARVFDVDFARGVDVLAWADGIRDGKVPVTEELDRLLDGDARAWAKELLKRAGRD
ncbi:MAG: phospholipase D-like domain-containing protein [Myxococcota bacterium]